VPIVVSLILATGVEHPVVLKVVDHLIAAELLVPAQDWHGGGTAQSCKVVVLQEVQRRDSRLAYASVVHSAVEDVLASAVEVVLEVKADH
jgi:hypothetical protein